MDTTARFTGKAEGYAKYRPKYAEAYIDYLVDSFGLTDRSVIADVGSGTGILTKQLLDRGFRVLAVEPNADMRAQAERELAAYPKFASLAGTAENTTLESASVDLVTVGQAFHWFDRNAFRAECGMILNPSGTVSLVWNSRDKASPIVQEIDGILKRYCPDYVGLGGIEDEAGVFERFFKGGVFDFRSFRNDVRYDLGSFIGRNLSVSDAPREGDVNLNAYIGELERLFSQYAENNITAVPYETHSYTGRV
jgi:SAM-dependent methyltransferase